MKTLFILTFLVFNFQLSISQSLTNGTYIGYEKNPFCYNSNCITIHDTVGIENKEGWYYRVTIEVKDSIITIEKMPIYFPITKDSIPYCDTAAFNGYYFYKVSENYDYSSNIIIGHLSYCKYCRRCGSATCKYVYAIYHFRKSGHNYYMDNASEKNIYFKRVQQAAYNKVFAAMLADE